MPAVHTISSPVILHSRLAQVQLITQVVCSFSTHLSTHTILRVHTPSESNLAPLHSLAFQISYFRHLPVSNYTHPLKKIRSIPNAAGDL